MRSGTSGPRCRRARRPRAPHPTPATWTCSSRPSSRPTEAAGFGAPRPVWPEALGERVPLAGFPAEATGTGPAHRSSTIPVVGSVRGRCIEVALKDEPEAQRQSPAGWDLAQGNLLLLGIAGSGTSTTLASLALAAAAAKDPRELDLLVLDLGSRALAPLAALPHTSAYVGTGPGAKEQQARFLRHLRTELARRRADPGLRRETLVLIDGLATLRDEFQDYDGQGLLDALNRAYADGPALGLYFAVATTRAKAVPSAIDEVTIQKWLYRLADPYDYSALGVRGSNIPAAVPGRCVDAGSLRQMHIATPGTDLAAAVESGRRALARHRAEGRGHRPAARGADRRRARRARAAGRASHGVSPSGCARRTWPRVCWRSTRASTC